MHSSKDGSSEQDCKPPAVEHPEVSSLEGVLPEHQDPQPPQPPSSVHGEVDEDDDNWSRQVDVVARGDDSSFRDGDAHDDDHHRGNSISEQQHVPTPQQPELTMKEKLVLRERQRRIETERARLKRQFALSGTDEGDEDGMNGNHEEDTARRSRDDDGNSNNQSVEEEGTLGEESTRAHPDDEESADDDANRRLGFNMERFLRNSDSFHPELEPTEEHNTETGAPGEQGVVMERFLNEPVVVSDAEVIDELALPRSPFGDEVHRPRHHDSAAPQDDVAGRVLDEENAPLENVKEPHRSVSFDIDVIEPVRETDAQMNEIDSSHAAMAGSQPSFGEDMEGGDSTMSNASVQSESTARDVADAPYSVGDPLPYSASLDMQADAASGHEDILSHASDEPRVLRLTEADMLEMASIEEASIGNAPPSDRDEEESLSGIGELADFRGGGHRFVGDTTISQDTPTTAVDSVSQISGNQSQRSAHLGTSAVSSSSADHHEADHTSEHHSMIEGMPSAPDSSHYLLEPGTASVTANPPSEGGRDEDVDDGSPHRDVDGVNLHYHGGDHDHAVQLIFEDEVARAPELPLALSSDSGLKDDTGEIVNQSGPDLVNRPRRYNPPPNRSLDNSIDLEGSPKRQGVVVDGFDFDKDAPRSPFQDVHDDSFRELPSDPWSPAGTMNVSPLHTGSRPLLGISTPKNANTTRASQMPFSPLNYGSVDEATDAELSLVSTIPTDHRSDALGRFSAEEKAPLLANVPPVITTQRELSEHRENDPEMARAHINGWRDRTQRWSNLSQRLSLQSNVDSVFSTLRSDNESEKAELQNESEAYYASSIIARGK